MGQNAPIAASASVRTESADSRYARTNPTASPSPRHAGCTTTREIDRTSRFNRAASARRSPVRYRRPHAVCRHAPLSVGMDTTSTATGGTAARPSSTSVSTRATVAGRPAR